MNREIKFRAWDNKNKKWLLGYDYGTLGGFSIYGECVSFGEWQGVYESFLFERNGKKWDDLKIMQYTGLKDKFGKEIYEGDIYEWEKEKGEIIFLDGCYKCRSLTNDFCLSSMIKEIKIIGNIYENSHEEAIAL